MVDRGIFNQGYEYQLTTHEWTTSTTTMSTKTTSKPARTVQTTTRPIQRINSVGIKPTVTVPTLLPTFANAKLEKVPPTENVAMRSPKKTGEDKSDKPVVAKQLARLRGGQSYNEGYLELRGLNEWGMVCDRPSEWTIMEANIVCKQLGYER